MPRGMPFSASGGNRCSEERVNGIAISGLEGKMQATSDFSRCPSQGQRGCIGVAPPKLRNLVRLVLGKDTQGRQSLREESPTRVKV
jgi:hypothetical protein